MFFKSIIDGIDMKIVSNYIEIICEYVMCVTANYGQCNVNSCNFFSKKNNHLLSTTIDFMKLKIHI